MNDGHRADLPPKIAIIGIGHEACGDDAVGRAVAERIRRSVSADVTVFDVRGNPATLLDVWKDVTCAIVVDAVRSDAKSGTIYRIDLLTETLPPDVQPTSSHGFGVARVVELGRILNRLPRQLILFGIAGERFEAGAPLSSSVAAAVHEVCRRIESEIAAIVR